MNGLQTGTLAAAAFTVMAAPQTIAQSSETLWDLSIEYQVDSLPGTVAQKFAKELGALTDGQISVTIHYGAALGFKSVDQFDAVSDGALPLASSFAGAWGGIDPIFLVASLPVVAPTLDDSRTLYEAAKPYFEESLHEANQILLAVTPWPNNGIWSETPITSVDDLQDLRIRTFDPLGTVTFKEIQASPVQLSWADVIPQLSTGALDAVLTSADGGSASSLWDLLPAYSQVPYASPWQILHMNRDSFDDLDPETQANVREAAHRAEVFGWQQVAVRTARNFSDMRAHDMTIAEEVPSELVKSLAQAGQAAVETWKSDSGTRGTALLDTFEAESATK
ncbi:C4-dicarboxylate ABC transporter substrate-binding protein (plasmid) [Paracoccus yeei]|uniref:C4-dicarboxylate ABC transporter substrate-binding protein n=1 Tax=Paracoccus yeei TaxID=147645 RepID=A0A1V0GYD6_9RHOB|nr:TRAP transporter substrate-binding protein [Paracoccus yeei]ARC38886.1 C4-dicarboxylate ABC transporter substrate-binding protein [Paracoccus yeei]